MRGKLLVTTGMVAGFMLGSWTPLGQVISTDTVQRTLFSLAQTTREQSATTVQAATLGRFQALIAAAQKEPTGNILQNQGIVMAAGFFDPEAAWAMHYSEFERTDGVAMASWSQNRSANTATPNTTPNRGSADANAWYSQTNEVELARLRATIAGIKAENTDIEANLDALDPAHPDHYMALCIHASNQGLIAFYTFLTKMGEEGVTRDDTAALASALQAQLGDAATHGGEGRTTAAEYADQLRGLPAGNLEEQLVREKALEYYESFVLSFDLEDTLAAHLASYPALIDDAITSREPPRGVSNWVASFQELGRSRMELQAYRSQIASELAGPTA